MLARFGHWPGGARGLRAGSRAAGPSRTPSRAQAQANCSSFQLACHLFKKVPGGCVCQGGSQLGRGDGRGVASPPEDCGSVALALPGVRVAPPSPALLNFSAGRGGEGVCAARPQVKGFLYGNADRAWVVPPKAFADYTARNPTQQRSVKGAAEADKLYVREEDAAPHSSRRLGLHRWLPRRVEKRLPQARAARVAGRGC